MNYADKSCQEFVRELASKNALGGGSAAALVGALGTSLASMVGNLTTGKKKYAQHEEAIQAILAEAELLQARFVTMIDEDAECFLPLSQAYSLPAGSEEEIKTKEEAMEKALKRACQAPVKLVHLCLQGIKLHKPLLTKGTRLAISDVGVGVQCLRAALISAQLNVVINLNLIKDQSFVLEVRRETERLVAEGISLADEIYTGVEEILRSKH